MISPQSIQKVKDRMEILDIVGQFVRLKKRGTNYIGNCPFHNEKTPSFTVSNTKGIYKCFGCGKAGNSITFIQEHEKLTYPEAIRWIANYYKIELEETQLDNAQLEQIKVEESLRAAVDFAQKYFTTQLLESEEGIRIGKSYFQERGFNEVTINNFLLGYAPENREAFYKIATENGFEQSILLKAGLINEKNGRVYDNYSGRVIFPIHNVSGRIIGFGARILVKNDKAPKYINTPENEIYNKSKTLYGLYQSRSAIAKEDEVLLVEGYTDVISLHQAGVQNVVSSSGTALTLEQLRLIKRFTKNITIIYDGDAAGIRAALRGMDMALEESLNVRLVLLPQQHDPDSYIQEVGAKAFTEYIQREKKDFILFKLEVSLNDAINDPVKKAELVSEIADTIAKLDKTDNFTLRQDYIKKCSILLNVDEAGLISLVNKKIRNKVAKEKEAITIEEDEPKPIITDDPNKISDELFKKDYQQERAVIGVLLEYGNYILDDVQNVAEFVLDRIGYDCEFIYPEWRKIFNEYCTYFKLTGAPPSQSFFVDHEDPQIQTSAINAFLSPPEISDNWENNYGITVPKRDETYRNYCRYVVIHFLLRKMRGTYDQYREDLITHKNNDTETEIIMNSMKIIKDAEQELLNELKVCIL